MPEQERRRIYRGYSEDQGSAIGPAVVFVEEEGKPPRRLKHELRHSPDGFSRCVNSCLACFFWIA
jgi:hypothetical protein